MGKIVSKVGICLLDGSTLGTVGAFAGLAFLFGAQMIFYFGSAPYIIGMVTGVVIAFWMEILERVR